MAADIQCNKSYECQRNYYLTIFYSFIFGLIWEDTCTQMHCVETYHIHQSDIFQQRVQAAVDRNGR